MIIANSDLVFSPGFQIMLPTPSRIHEEHSVIYDWWTDGSRRGRGTWRTITAITYEFSQLLATHVIQ